MPKPNFARCLQIEISTLPSLLAIVRCVFEQAANPVLGGWDSRWPDSIGRGTIKSEVDVYEVAPKGEGTVDPKETTD